MRFDLYNRAALTTLVLIGPDWYARPANYLRLSVNRMTALCDALLRLGMAYDAASFEQDRDRPAFGLPRPQDYGLTATRDEYGDTVWSGRRHAEFESARQVALRRHVPESQPGIPLHKLSTALGWIVDGAECGSALDGYRAARSRDVGHPRAFGDHFITFLAACTAGTGFVVGRAVPARPEQDGDGGSGVESRVLAAVPNG
ncbi:hypothetical protein ABZ863_17550 [Saccharomonospora sp. NPDC046836]|uniref:hypothetical protein n=1 Tax=Saccharomonospora sp. NPDC046836 TaxID=3156921 RepID=UPI0033D576F6